MSFYFLYLTQEKPTGGKGCPRLYDGKIEMEHLKGERFEITDLENGGGRILSAIVHSRSPKRNIRLCIWESENKKVRKLYFSTDTKMKAIDVFDYYRTRFQIEFCYGDSCINVNRMFNELLYNSYSGAEVLSERGLRAS